MALYMRFRRFNEPGSMTSKGTRRQEKYKTTKGVGQWDCNLQHRMCFSCMLHSAGLVRVGCDVKSASQLQTVCAANRSLWCMEIPRQILESRPHKTEEGYATDDMLYAVCRT